MYINFKISYSVSSTETFEDITPSKTDFVTFPETSNDKWVICRIYDIFVYYCKYSMRNYLVCTV